jgi:riboflavin kinase
MEISGRVAAGLGEGASYVRKYNKYFLQKLGFRAFPGTLNIRARLPGVKNTLLIEPVERELHPVECVKVVINNAMQGAVVRPFRTVHENNILEIIAPVNLKKYFSLKDGDKIQVKIK